MKRYVSTICVTCCFVLIFVLEGNKFSLTQDSVQCSSIGEKAMVFSSDNVQNNYLSQKEVFLTFDDGPCENNTRRILEILNHNNVKATFFIVGIKGEENPQILKEISDSGMSIGVHTYSHDYKKVYKNLEFYLNDFQACKNVIKNIAGREPVPYIRLPGGSDNLVTSKNNLETIKSTLKEKGINYVDWNVSAEDAVSKEITSEEIKKNIISQCEDKKLAVILMHDAYYKNFTVEALPDIINYLKSEGFVFRTFDELTITEENVMKRIGIVNRV